MPKKKDKKAAGTSAKTTTMAAENASAKVVEEVNGATADSSEADKVKLMIKNMPKKVELGSEWYIVSMTWIDKWQKWVGFESSTEEQKST